MTLSRTTCPRSRLPWTPPTSSAWKSCKPWSTWHPPIDQVLEEGVALLRETGLDAVGSLSIWKQPAEAIGLFASEVGADFVVVGHHRRSAIERWWHGSIGHSLLDRLPLQPVRFHATRGGKPFFLTARPCHWEIAISLAPILQSGFRRGDWRCGEEGARRPLPLRAAIRLCADPTCYERSDALGKEGGPVERGSPRAANVPARLSLWGGPSHDFGTFDRRSTWTAG